MRHMSTKCKCEWNPSYSVGNDLMDQQHQKLIALCRRAGDCAKMTDAKSVQDFHEILHEVAEYSRYHFAAEEALLRKHSYSELPNQVQTHERLIDELTEFLMLPTVGQSQREGFAAFLQNWVKSHILVEDMKYKSTFTK